MRPFHSFVVFAMAISAMPAASQSPPTRTLTKPDAEFRDPFTSITSVRELSDGRVIAVDRAEKSVMLVDLREGRATPISRVGGGPTEYAAPGRLYALRGDTTLLADAQNLRYLIIGPTGEARETFALETDGDRRMTGLASAISLDGAYFFIGSRRSEGNTPMSRTEIAQIVQRRTRADKHFDTLATLAVPLGRMTGARTIGGGRLFYFDSRPLAGEDAVAFGVDGRVAIVRAADYHVEWIQSDGRIVKGPPVPYTPVRVTDAEKKAFIAAQTRQGQITVMPPAGGAPSAGSTGGAAAGGAVALPPGVDLFSESNMVWPATKPAFFAGDAIVAADGRLWVLRARAHDDPIPTYDVFDQRGQLVQRVTLPSGTRVVGFGAGAVYVARKDADDLVYLQRYR